ncbi:MAG: uroporphyrinogen decarboxylase family protein [Candidatus Brocadiia bacterium]
MRPAERVVAQLEHRETDFVPYVLSVEEAVAARLDEYYGDSTWRDLKQDHIANVGVTHLFDLEAETEATARDPFGSLWRTDREPMHMLKPALPEPDLSGYSFPEPDDLFREDWLETGRRRCEELHGQGLFVIGVLGYCLFERSWTMRGFENALMDMVAHRAFYEELLERITELNLEIIERFLRLPLDGIQTGDDWGAQRGVIMGTERWRELMLPRYARMWGRIKQAGLYTMHHSCGNVSEVVEDVAEAGLDCLESVQPEAMDPYKLKKRHGRRIAFWGGLGTQRLLPRGTPEEVRREVHRLCREMGRGGGYILAPAKPIMADVPTPNAAAAVEAFLGQSGRSL